MLGKRTLALALPLAFAAFAFAPPADAGAPFDGAWRMIVQTTNGHCGKIKVSLAIRGNRISSTSGSFALHRIRVDGQITGATGTTRMTAVAGPRVAKGSGHFTRKAGSGKWNGSGPSGLCSGIWTATRA